MCSLVIKKKGKQNFVIIFAQKKHGCEKQRNHGLIWYINFNVELSFFYIEMNPPYYSPAPFSENSMTSDGSLQMFATQDMEPTVSDEEGSGGDDDGDRSNKKRIHRDIEARRREMEGKHMRELSTLIPHWYDMKPIKLPQLAVLKMAADLLDKLNARYEHNPMYPSHLTEDEINFLNFEASNAFLFITTIESTGFRVVYTTDSIQRVLNIAPEQWLGQDLLQFIHPEDSLHVQSQLSSIAQLIDNKPRFKCRLQQGNSSYSSVTINGTIKKLDQSLKPVSPNEYGTYAFVGICSLPLTSEYSEKNLSLYKNPESLVFSCRCSPDDWKIFLVDCSVSTFPSISSKNYRDKSILEFIYPDDRIYVEQHLNNATLTGNDELITCHFVYSSTEILSMILEIKPLVNTNKNRTDCLELVFKHIVDMVKNPTTDPVDDLFN